MYWTGSGRILEKSTLLGGFQVPKGTVVVAMNQVSKIKNKNNKISVLYGCTNLLAIP